jgi:hypothetical protein
MLKLFINQVISVVKRNTDEATANRIFTEIMNQVVLPMQRKQELTGDVMELMNEE